MPPRSRSRRADEAAARPGAWAEEVARAHLESEGYVLVAANHLERRGEIDLVMRDGRELVFVEVRQRLSSCFGTPGETIGPPKVARLMRTARLFMLRHYGSEELDCRFDAVLVHGSEGAFRLEHVRDIVG